MYHVPVQHLFGGALAVKYRSRESLSGHPSPLHNIQMQNHGQWRLPAGRYRPICVYCVRASAVFGKTLNLTRPLPTEHVLSAFQLLL